jgi:hypothetical protein
MSRPELPDDFEVYIDTLDEQGRVTYISGFFEYKNNRLKFGAIGMEGYGGPNINATLSEETIAELRKLSMDDEGIDNLITALQRKIMDGQAHIQLRDEPTQTQNRPEGKKENQPT